MPKIERKILLISPHPDDIAYSCLLPALDKKNTATVLTVFSRSKYAYESSIAYDVDVVTAIRKAEDMEFCRIINAQMHSLDYPDSSITFSSEKMFLDLYPYHKELAEVIRSYIIDNHFIRVYFPMALGWHYDHKIIRDVILKEVVQQLINTIEFVMYEDMPYTCQFTYDEIKKRLKSIVKANGYSGLSSSKMESSDVTLQTRAIEIYKSQYEADTVNQIISHKIVGGKIVEKFYKLYV